MKVLFATDGKAASENAGRLLVALGGGDRLEVAVLSVNSFSFALEEGARTEHHYSPAAGRAHAAEVVERALLQLKSGGMKAEGKVADGHPPSEILDEIDRGAYDLALLGSGTATWLGQVLLGSVATKVVHGTSVATLVCLDAPADGPLKVVVGTDGSPDADLAIDTLIDLADPRRISVHVVSVSPGAEAGGDRPNVEEASAAALDRLEQAGIETTREILEGHPTQRLLGAAKGLEAALVVVGARGLGASGRSLLGSVTDRIVRHAPATLVGPKRAP